MKIFIGADHRGFKLKEKVKGWLAGQLVEDVGAHTFDPKDDYPLYAGRVASRVAQGEGLGILICGSGVGVDVVANKFDGVRAGLGKSAEQIRAGRNDDDMNVLVIAADYTDENEARKMVEAFLTTKFSGKARYVRRLKDIERIEANN